MEEETQTNVEQEVSSTVPETVTVTKESIEDVETVKKEKKTENCQFKSRLGIYLVKADLPQHVLDAIYWNKIPKTAGMFGAIMFLLMSLYWYPFLTVVTNFCLALLAVAFLYRIGMTIVNAVQKTSPEHPFQKLLEKDIKVSDERVDSFSKCLAKEINCTVKCSQDLFLVKDVFKSMKFGVLLWLLSYVASWISPLTMLTLCVLLAFTVPKLYEEKYVQIDEAIKSVTVAIGAVLETAKQKLPPSALKYLGVNEEKKTN